MTQWRLMSGVPDDAVRLLLSVARRRRFARREVVFHRDDPADSLHLVEKGRFAVRITTPLGDTVTIAIRGPGDSFGEMALVAGEQKRSATIAALEDAETFAVYKTDFERLRGEHPTVDAMLMTFLTSEVRRQNELLLEALYLPVERRVVRRLVELAHTYEDAGAVIPLTQDELAELAGATRSTVNRVLREERDRGTVELRRGRTVVLDLDALARRAG